MCFNNGYIFHSFMYVSNLRKSFFPVHFQPHLCGLTNGNTRSLNWGPALSIPSSYWLIMFPNTPLLFKLVLVSKLSHCHPYYPVLDSTFWKWIFSFRRGSRGGCSHPSAAAGCGCIHLLPPVQDRVSLWDLLFSSIFFIVGVDCFSIISSMCTIISSMCRCKSYFFPTISSPWSGKMGHWLINPPPQVI